MDFQSLTRKELQSLCKQNKIPANMTNIAMADALKALDKVEGRDEFMNGTRSDPQQSPDKTVDAEPRTVVRTSTRRKPVTVEPESSTLLTRTRRTTRKTSAEEAEQENKNASVLQTPAIPASRRKIPVASTRRKIYTQLMESEEDEKPAGEEKSNDPPVTPAIRSSNRKKTEARNDGKSVQRAYSTRRSMRLLEKGLADLNLKEESAVEVVKIEGLCEEAELVKKDEMPAGVSEMVKSLENEGETKHEVQEENKENKTDYYEVKNNVKVEMGFESCNDLDSRLGSDSEDKQDDSSGESLLQVEISEKTTATDQESIKNGADLIITEDLQTLTAALGPEVKKELMNDQDILIEEVPDEVKEPENVSIVNAADEVINLPIPKVSEVEGEVSVEVMHFTEMVAEEVCVQGIDLPTPKASEVESEDDTSLIKEMSDNGSPVVRETENVSIVNAANQVIDLPTMKLSDVEDEVTAEVSDLTEMVEKSHAETGKVSDEIATVKESDVYETDNTPRSVKHNKSSDSNVTPRSVKQNSPFVSRVSDTEVAAEEFSDSEIPVEEFSVTANESVQNLEKSPCAPFSGNTIQGQFPRPNASTPRKSSTMKQATNQKIILAEVNKENIDNSGRKLEPKKDPMKKQINVKEDISLRQLRKQLKEQQLAKKNNEGKTASKVETRPALQALPENRIAAEEPQQNN